MKNKQKVLMKELYPLVSGILETNGTATFTVSGVSMQPMVYNKRDTVTLEKVKGPLKKFDLPFYLMDDGRFLMHRVIRIHKDGTYECRGDNCWTSEDPIRDDQIIGIVKSFTRNGKKIDVDKSFGYYIYTRTWPLLHHFKKWYSLVRKLKLYKKYLSEFLHPEKVKFTKKDGTMATITYRDARPSDIAQLKPLLLKQLDYERENFICVPVSRSWLQSKEAEKYYESLMRNQFFHVALDGGKIIGFYCGHISEKKSDDFSIAYGNGLYIDPNYRGAGIAQNFLAKFKEFCKSRGCYHIKFEIYADNTAAETLYRKIGFKDYKKCLLCELD